MVKIRLMRIGAKRRPFYRVVVVDERAKRTGAYIELLGTYNPLTEPKEIHLKQDRIDHWKKQGAQLSDGFLRIIGKAPQRPPRKPKKSKQVTGDSEQVKTEEVQISEGEASLTGENASVEPTKDEQARGDGEEGSTGEATANEMSENAPGDTEPARFARRAGPRAEETENNK